MKANRPEIVNADFSARNIVYRNPRECKERRSRFNGGENNSRDKNRGKIGLRTCSDMVFLAVCRKALP